MTPKLWINGKWEDGRQRKTRPVLNPATEETLAEVQEAGAEDVGRAVQAAHDAYQDRRWSGLTKAERSKILWKVADLMERDAQALARVESDNTGKPYEALSLGGDIPFSIDNLRFFAAAARNTQGSTSDEYMKGYSSILRREPVGVVGQVAPWNYPLMMAVWKIGPALAAGCTVVLKPAPATPLTTLMLADLLAEAGVPAGVVNIVTGGNETGQALVEHPLVRMVSLTGSTNTGKQIMRTAAETLKRVHLELGGKAPFVVFEDADVARVAQVAAFAATMNTGQDCTAATRVYVAKSRVKEVEEAVTASMRAVQVGTPYEKGVAMGPLISAAQKERVEGFVARAKSAGAKILTGGAAPKAFKKGYFYEPTVISGVRQDAEIVQQEVFGPVLTIQSFEGDAQAVQFANDVVYGLAASIWTGDVGRAMSLSARLEFGTVWVNDHLPLTSETPHGGFKQSGFGKDLSMEAVGDYQVTKHVMVKNG
jgi:betaine-aldehyde dehydrogenase